MSENQAKRLTIYVASSWRNMYQQETVAYLRGLNHEVYDFRNPAPGDTGFGWSEIDPNWKDWTVPQYVAALRHPLADKGFKNDFDAMQRSNLCVLVHPCGNSANFEAGWFAGRGIPVIHYIPAFKEAELMYKIEPAALTGTLEGVAFAINALRECHEF